MIVYQKYIQRPVRAVLHKYRILQCTGYVNGFLYILYEQ